jgi:hypothetical protein
LRREAYFCRVIVLSRNLTIEQTRGIQ